MANGLGLGPPGNWLVLAPMAIAEAATS